jgi:xanthine dehydrogenase large subunit
LIHEAYLNRINLSAQALYATPHLSYDKSREQGRPFAYHVYGAGIVEVELDVVRGIFSLVSIKVLHDTGHSLAPEVDKGQIEGALVQGLGWATLEHLVFAADGRVLSNALASYKVPDLNFIPDNFEVRLFDRHANPEAIMGSKGVGEPPLLYGLAGFFALADAMRAAKQQKSVPLSLPLTGEKILCFLAET